MTNGPPTIIPVPATRSPIIIPKALAPLAAEKRWVVWKLKWVAGKDGRHKPTKPPFRADVPSLHASSTDPSTWSDLETAMRAYVEKRCDGIGLALTDSDIAAFDIDDCRNDSTETIHPWAQDLVRRSGSYAEVTPSGEGIRIIGRGSGEPVHRKISVPDTNGVSCELYRKASRYITITGQTIQCGDAAELVNIDALLDQTLADLDGEKPNTTNGAFQGAQREHDLDSLIKDGCREDFGGDRSRAVWYVINQRLKQGRTADEIVAVLLDRSNGISAHIYDQSQPEQYARKQVEKAHRERQEQAADQDAAEIARLAQLSLLDYEHEREDSAERLGVRTTILDKLVKNERGKLGLDDNDDQKQGHALDLFTPEPWPEPVNGAALLDEITTAIQRHVVMAEHAARACALWCVHTYLLDSFFISPRLAIRSTMHRCGKTTLLDIISHLVLRTLSAANVTAASVFRVVEACRPTLLIDEADTFLSGAEELRGVINSGHRKGGKVIRTVGDDHEPRLFSTYAACAIALIGKLPATLHDRSAPVIDLKRRLGNESVENFRLDRTAHLDALARKAARWTANDAEQLRDADPKLPAGLFSRDADNWRPLLAIAEMAGGKWPEQAREAAAICCAVTGVEDASQLELLLSDIRDVFAAKKADASTSADGITSDALVEWLVKIEGHPWAEMGQKPLTQNRLARMLRPLGIGPGEVGPETARKRGYKFAAFREPFDCYLKPLSEDQRSQNAPQGALQLSRCPERDEMGTSDILQPSSPTSGWTVEKCEKPNNDGVLDGCTVAKGGAEENSIEPGLLGSEALSGADDRPDRPSEDSPLKNEALDGADANFPPTRTGGASSPVSYEVLGPAPLGQRCTICGNGIGAKKIRRNGHVSIWHTACADRRLAAKPP